MSTHADRCSDPSPAVAIAMIGRVALPSARLFAPVALVLSIAWPEHTHFEIDRMPPAADAVARLQEIPADQLLEELAGIDLGVGLGIEPSSRLAAAEQLVAGYLIAPAFTSSPVTLRGWPADLQVDGPTFQLSIATLAGEALLLEQFERHLDRRFYLAARSRILAFADWEKQQRQQPTKLWMLWNDHAVAGRIATLIRLWRHVRTDPTVSDAERAELVALVARSGELLAKPSHFTVRTNHGVMQNVALLQIAAAFPLLPQAERWRELAVERLNLQLGFYVSPEGIVLEHSAGYHVLGSELLAYALRLGYLNGVAPSDRLVTAARGTQEFNRVLLRPDGTLPAFGNTAARLPATLRTTDEHGRAPVARIAPPFPAPPPASHLYPISGYAVWWSRSDFPSQTIIAWALHERHGHKHADEPSVLLWSRGYDWITSSGYWPYGRPLYSAANGWRGANAPHRVGEPADSPRDVALLASGGNEGMRFVDIENRRSNGFLVRRQIVQIGPETLLVVDFHSGAGEAVETLWTIDPRVQLSGTDGRSFVGDAPDGPARITLTIAAADKEAVDIELHRGSHNPFGGWVVVGSHPTPASAVRVRYGKESGASATLLAVADDAGPTESVALESGTPEQWRVKAKLRLGEYEVTRSGMMVTVSRIGHTEQLPLSPPPNQAEASLSLRDAMAHGVEKFPPWRDLTFYTHRLYLVIALAWAGTEFFLLLIARRRRRMLLEALPIPAWAVVALWVHRVYLV